MARTNNLSNFLTDVADAIREKKGSNDTILASDFDTEIENLPSSGGKYAPRIIKFDGYKETELNYEISNLDTSNITDMSNMFASCINLISINLSNFDTRNVTTMNNMFSSTSSLKELNLNSFDLSNLVDISSFCNASTNLEKITITNKIANKLKNMNYMLSGCTKLTDVNLEINIELEGGFSVNNRISMTNMFSGCSLLQELDLSGLVIPDKIFNVSSMFLNCVLLTKIDIRNIILNSKTTQYTNMFGASASNGVPDNCEIIVANDTIKTWITSKFSRLTNVKTVAEYEAE